MDILTGFIIIWSISLAIWLFYQTNYNEAKTISNSDELNNKIFAKGIEKSNEKIEIFDDGNNSEKFNSAYDNEKIIAKLEEKIKTNSKFKVNIKFNFKENLAINRLLKEYPKQVSIKYNKNNTRNDIDNDELHFKIFDNGNFCYISKHELNSSARKIDIYEKNTFGTYHPIVSKYKRQFAEQDKVFS